MWLLQTQMKDALNVPILLYKAEYFQIMDSIQTRGVIYTLLQLSDEQKRKGVIAISTGHFAHILSYFGKEFGIPVTVVMPSSTAHETVDKCRGLSATVIVQGDNMVDVHRIALCNARTSGLVYIDGYSFLTSRLKNNISNCFYFLCAIDFFLSFKN